MTKFNPEIFACKQLSCNSYQFTQALQAYMAYKQLNEIQNDASGLGGYNDTAGFAGAYGGSPFPPHTESAGGNYQSPYAS